MLQNVLITVIGPQRNQDLAVPGDVPVHILIPVLLALCVLSSAPPSIEGSSWCLRLVQASTPLSPLLSLSDADVVDGSIVVLEQMPSLQTLLEQAPTAFTPTTVLPSRASGGIGITWTQEKLLP